MSVLLRTLVALGLLVALVVLVDPDAWRAVPRVLELPLLLAALALTGVQVVLATARWRIMARRLGHPLPVRLALQETYLATLLNQLLPGGVAGDAARAWRLRHGAGLHRSAGSVALERALGQAVLVAACLVALVAQPAVWHRLAGGGLWQGVLLLLCVLGLLASIAWRLRRVLRLRQGMALVRDRVLSRPRALAAMTGLSLLLLVAYLAVFVLAARATGTTAPLPVLLPLMLVCLLAMSIPLGFGGLGLREGAAALAWAAAGLPPGQGVAAALGYGVLALVCSLPAALVLAGSGRHRRSLGKGPSASPQSPSRRSSSNRVS